MAKMFKNLSDANEWFSWTNRIVVPAPLKKHYVKVKEIENITYRKLFIQESTKQLSMDNYDHDYENNSRSIIFILGSKSFGIVVAGGVVQ